MIYMQVFIFYASIHIHTKYTQIYTHTYLIQSSLLTAGGQLWMSSVTSEAMIGC